MNPGKLRHLVRIERPINAHDAQGRLVRTWELVASTLAGIEPLSARDLIAAQQAQSEVTARITLRHRTDLSPEMRITHGDTIYRIHGITPDAYSGNRHLTVLASTGVSTDGS